jgi:hypothetical protein
MLIGFAAAYRDGGWLEAPLFELADEPESEAARLRPFAGRATPDVALPASLIPRLTDHHVHLGLADAGRLFAGGITHVTDLGWEPSAAHEWTALAAPHVSIAGALLSCVGGYPLNAGWGPAGSTVEIAAADDADTAVAAQQEAGASVIKVTLNSGAGPVPNDALLDRIASAAHARGLPVYAHAQGSGQAARAFAAGIDVLAHAPFSERLPDALLTAMAARGTTWVSTLQIHGWGTPTREFGVASDNVRRFSGCGGVVLYGTDLGNGDLPIGVNADELASLADVGVDPMAAIARGDAPGQPTPAHDGGTGRHVALVAGAPPIDPADLPGWLAGAQGRTVDSVVAEATSAL